jgi:hypothetical protein
MNPTFSGVAVRHSTGQAQTNTDIKIKKGIKRPNRRNHKLAGGGDEAVSGIELEFATDPHRQAQTSR